MPGLPVRPFCLRCPAADSGANGDGPDQGRDQARIAIPVRYGAMNWIGEFEYKPAEVIDHGARVVIQTDRGIELGEQISLNCQECRRSLTRDRIETYLKASGPEFYRLRAGRIQRQATPQDLAEARRLNANRIEDLTHCAEEARRAGLDMKLVTAEHLLGGERIVFYFRAEERIDFRQLVRDLAQHHQTRIELRQVGARDEARLVADYEICGRECCCRNFLKKLRPVTMKMAKLQKSTLDPTKVSGRCGRLRCCLRYENQGYEELHKQLPRGGARVNTEHGPAVVIDRQVLTQLLLVRTEDGIQITVPNEELLPPGQPTPKPPVQSAPPPTNDAAEIDPELAPTKPGRRKRRSAKRPPDQRRPDEQRPESAATDTPHADEQRPPTAKADQDPPKPQTPGEPRGQRRRRRRRGRGDQRGRPDAPPSAGSDE